MNDIQQKALEMVQEMAKHLGVGAGHVWEVVVTQAVVGSVSRVIEILFLWSLVFLVYKTAPKVYALLPRVKKTQSSYPYKNEGELEEAGIVMCVCAAILVGVAIIITYGSFNYIATGFVNPEFRAADYLLSKLGK